jgi:hypothetical protein
MLRDRIAAAIQGDGSGAEIKNLCDALYTLEGRGKEEPTKPGPLVVRFVGDAEQYAL